MCAYYRKKRHQYQFHCDFSSHKFPGFFTLDEGIELSVNYESVRFPLYGNVQCIPCVNICFLMKVKAEIRFYLLCMFDCNMWILHQLTL